MKFRFLLTNLIFLAILVACNASSQESPQEPLEILFVGNSYTFFNDLPHLFAVLAESGEHQVNVTTMAKGGYSLARHAADKATLSLLESKHWDYVILQEKSDIPAIPEERDESMYPAVQQLNDLVTGQEAETILFMTWGYRDGMPEAGLVDYDAMQTEIATSYQEIADRLGIRLSPIGLVWQESLQKDPQINLWIDDGSHPTPLGSYLAVDVLYAVIFKERSPGVVDLDKSISGEKARLIQEITAETVIENFELWNIP